MSEKIILAGASSVIGHEKIIEAFSSIGMDVAFIEAPFVKKYFKDASDKFIYMENLPPETTAIPLSEYWISQCIKTKQCAISEKALKASRSKKYLYEILSVNGNKVPEIFDGIAEARNFILNTNGRVIVKPEGLFSGYAVKTVGKENLNDIEQLVLKASDVHNNAIKLFEIESKGALVTELISGDEYSADLFLCKGKLTLVRLSKKVVVEIHGTPCTVICQLVPCSADFFEQMSKWCNVLFGDGDISFAQFDFIDCGDGQLVPIDFACRVGGGMAELFGECESNVYADAVCGKQYQVQASNGYLTQLNYVPTKSGIIEKDDYNLADGKQFIYKHKGDFVPESPSSVASRIAVVIKKAPLATAKDAEELLIGDERIKFWKKK
ncbi:hypothetical protein [Treponema sp.]|uniref:hypothetical protein n=1 Tax=Treponema sp. TaxID=166 RepID=UPI00298E679A|nr:hypothetical protein [Treponema sp.]MCQ2240172.1 hypothetical protein [Treponema sp.]